MTCAAILLIDPKYPHNLGAIVRTCAAFGVRDVRYTGNRIDRRLSELSRLPREERMRGYRLVDWRRTDRPFDDFPMLTPVAIEVRENSESLPAFEHPADALYVFGPEDGSLTNVTLRHCHRFVAIPTRHCLNLSIASAPFFMTGKRSSVLVRPIDGKAKVSGVPRSSVRSA